MIIQKYDFDGDGISDDGRKFKSIYEKQNVMKSLEQNISQYMHPAAVIACLYLES